MLSEERLVTAETLARMPPEDARIELVKGEIIRKPLNGVSHGLITAKLSGLLYEFIKQHRLGAVFGSGTGFILGRNPDTVRAPDVAYVTAERAAEQERQEHYFFDGRSLTDVQVFTIADTLDGGEALPGFSVAVEEIFS